MGLIVVGPSGGGFLPSRMTKVGATSNFGTGQTQITGWAADTVGYPGSTVSSNDLVVQAAGAGVTIDANIEFTNGAAGSRTITLRLLLDGVEIATSGAVSMGFGATLFVAASATGLTVAQASLVRATAQPSLTNSVSATGNTASYVRIYQP